MRKILVIWLVAISLSVVSMLSSFGNVTKSIAPDIAVSIFPANGFALENVASNLVRSSVARNSGQFENSVSSEAFNNAARAFILEPLTPEAIAIVAISKKKLDQRLLMQNAFSLSRRVQLVTGWLIADSGSQNDLPAVLGYYDTVLRINVSSQQIIIPLMAKALTNDDFIAPLAKLLSKTPTWSGAFWRQVIVTPEAIENAAVLRARTFQQGEIEVYKKRDAELIGALVSARRFETAWELYDLLTRSKERGKFIHNGDFSMESDYPPMNWQLTNDGEFGATIDNGKLILSAAPNSGGMFARQLVYLSKETLELSVTMDSAISKTAELNLDLSCAETNNEKLSTVKMRIQEATVRQRISNKNTSCKYFWLSVFGRSAENGNGFDMSIDSIRLFQI